MTESDNVDLPKVISKNVRQVRKIRGLSQDDVADEAGMHRNSIGTIERGEKHPSLKSLKGIADALGVHPRTLLSPPDEALEEVRASVTNTSSKSRNDAVDMESDPLASNAGRLAKYLRESRKSTAEEDDEELVEAQPISEMKAVLSSHLSKRGVADNRLAGKIEGKEKGVILLPPYEWETEEKEDTVVVTIRGNDEDPGDTVWSGDTSWTTTCERVVASQNRRNALIFYRNLDGQPERDVLVPLQRSRVKMLESVSPGESLQKDEFLDHPNNTKDDGSRQSDGPRRWRELRKEYGFSVWEESQQYHRGTTIPPVETPNPRPDMAALKRKYWDDLYEHHDGECNICGREVQYDYDKDDSGLYGLLDHRVPVLYGGSDEKENLQVVCQECNNIKKRLYKHDPERYQSESLALAYPEQFERFHVQLDSEEATVLKALAEERGVPTRTFAGHLLGAAARMLSVEE